MAIFLAANSIFALSSTTAGLFPPSSRMHGTKLLPAALATNLPFSELPVKHIKSNLVFVNAFATSTLPSTHEKLDMSSALTISFLIALQLRGAISEGLITAQFPAVIALISGPRVVNRGKFHEPMMQTTPRGSKPILLLPGPRFTGVETATP